MGDPHSPAMTIGACAWMEKQWLEGIDERSKEYFTAVRYMDDILLFVAKSEEFDYKCFINDLENTVYFSPLKLQDGDKNTFLENTITIKDNKIKYRLKNNNNFTADVWRYPHYHSYTAKTMKAGILLSAMKKVHKMTSDQNELIYSAMQKISEFAHLQYPKTAIRIACNKMASTTRESVWFRVRELAYASYY
jgi:hypothetical protein